MGQRCCSRLGHGRGVGKRNHMDRQVAPAPLHRPPPPTSALQLLLALLSWALPPLSLP